MNYKTDNMYKFLCSIYAGGGFINIRKIFIGKEIISVLPIIFAIAIIPLIIHEAVVFTDQSLWNLWWVEKVYVDYHASFRVMIFIINSLIGGLFVAYKLYKDSDMRWVGIEYSIPVRVYFVFVLLSTLFSDNFFIATIGYPLDYRGAFVILSYIIVLITAMYLVTNEYQIKFILISLLISASLIALIGLFQYAGFNIFETKAARALIFSDYQNYTLNKPEIKHVSSWITSTIGHYNHVGSYFAMIVPLIFSITVLVKNLKQKIYLAPILLLASAFWILCSSRAGMVGGVIAIALFLVMIYKNIINNKKFLICGLIVFFVFFITMNLISQNHVLYEMGKLVRDAKNIFLEKKNEENSINKTFIKDIVLKDSKATIVTNTETLIAVLNFDKSISFKDENGKYLDTTFYKHKAEGYIRDPRYMEYRYYIYKTKNDDTLIIIKKEQLELAFIANGEELNLSDNRGNIINYKSVEKWGFSGNELIGSKRGYTWSRSIPLLKQTLLLGYGPDNYILNFPQYDIIGKSKIYSSVWKVIYSPHSLYLEIGINTGVISLLAILTLFGMYIVQSCKLYFGRNFNNFTEIGGVGIFSGVCGYLIAGLFNDSVVAVAPVFWGLLGMGIAINSMLKQRSEA